MESREFSNQLEKRKYEPTEILEYTAQIGRDFEQYAVEAQAMIEEAKERGIPINLSDNEALKKFAPRGEYEIILIKLRNELQFVRAELLNQGVKMTKEDLDSRLEKMGVQKK